MARITLGLIGLGTVGSGVVRLLYDNGDLIWQRTGIQLWLKTIADRGIHEFRDFPLHDFQLAEDPRAVLDDPEIEIVIELIGGLEPARSYLRDAIERGKHVVTANKALLAASGAEIFALADRTGVEVGFEGSVAGTVPIIRVLQEGLAANRIEAVCGIVNGTTNYILTRMIEDGQAYGEALGRAQELGFAEADPTLDVDGEDAAHKLAILATLAFGVRPDRSSIHVEGIRAIDGEDVAFARQHDFVIKLLAVGRRVDGAVELRVHPALVPRTHPLATVRNEFNAVFIRGDASRETMYYGRGAGSMPTASAVVSDVIEIAERGLRDCKRAECRAAARSRSRSLYWGEARFAAIDDARCRYYLRLPVHDQPGAIGVASTILGGRGVSLATVRARVVDGAAGSGRIEILTHEAREGDVRGALAAIAAAGVLQGEPKVIRVEE